MIKTTQTNGGGGACTEAKCPTSAVPRFLRGTIIAGVSLVSVLCIGSLALAQSLQSRNGAVAGALSNQAAQAAAAAAAQQVGQAGLSPEQTQGLQRQLSLQARNALAIEAMRNAQSAARAAAVAGPNFLRDAKGNPLNAVPNGLGTGGLDPAVTVKTPYTPNGEQREIWQGGELPTQAVKDGKYEVTVKQTEERAIFSWKTFNVGKETELLFDQAGNKGWVALNRVVGGLDENGRRTAGLAPSQILGKIKADGTVLVLNQNGVIFGGSSQVNVNTLIVSTAEIGRDRKSFTPGTGDQNYFSTTLSDRNGEFLANGLTGTRQLLSNDASCNTGGECIFYSDLSPFAQGKGRAASLKRELPDVDTAASILIRADAGAQLAAGKGGSVILNAFNVENAGTISAEEGNVSLVSSFGLNLRSYDGTATGGNPNLRGLVGEAALVTENLNLAVGGFTDNALFNKIVFSSSNSGLISTPRGSINVGTNSGILTATTSVSRNGSITVANIADGGIVSILPDENGETLPQDPQSISTFKRSVVNIGYYIGKDALVLAPGGNVTLGNAGQIGTTVAPATNRLFVDTGAVIDVSGLKDIVLPATRNQLTIGPLKGNELADSGGYQNSFLNGATVYLDPRRSGVRSDGVAWIGSPLIDAKAIAEQVGVGVSELLTKGGNVTVAGTAVARIIGNGNTINPLDPATLPDTIVKQGAVIDISGGWTRYQPGIVRSTQLLGADGRTYDIADADPTKIRIVGFAGDFIVNHPRWGITERYSSLGGSGKSGVSRFVDGYIEGRDAGTAQFTGSVTVLDLFGKDFHAEAYAGLQQLLQAQPGTGKGQFAWDQRPVQQVASQLPSGGALRIGAAVPSTGLTPAATLAITMEDRITRLADAFAYGVAFANVDRNALFANISGDSRPTIAARTTGETVRLPETRRNTIQIADTLINNSGLSQFSVSVDGPVTVQTGVDLRLAPGGVFDVSAGGRITVDGNISAPAGKIQIETKSLFASGTNTGSFTANPFDRVLNSNNQAGPSIPRPLGVGSFDITIDGSLSTRGLWTNDFGASADSIKGAAWQNGGAISLSAQRVFLNNPADARTPLDVSGSILVKSGAVIDLTSGGYVDPTGKLSLTAKGGSLSLFGGAYYFGPTDVFGALDVSGVKSRNPAKVNQRVAIDPTATILSSGFGGGGTFSLTTPEFAFGDGVADVGTQLPLGFISR